MAEDVQREPQGSPEPTLPPEPEAPDPSIPENWRIPKGSSRWRDRLTRLTSSQRGS